MTSSDKRSDVIAKAIAIFSTKGYRGASMNDLAEAAGLSKSSLYHYFRSKEDMLVEIYEDVLRHNVEIAREIRDSELPTETKLRHLLVERVEYVCRNQKILQIFFEEEAELPKKLLTEVFEVREAYVDLVRGLIDEGVREGIFVVHASPAVVVNVLLGATNWIYKWYSPAGPQSAQQLGADVTNLLLGAISAPASGA